MSRKESRRERKNQDEQTEYTRNREGISRIYYIVIGVLFLILAGLLIFIFSRSGDDVSIDNENESAEVQEANETGLTEETPEQSDEANNEEGSDDNQANEQEVDETAEDAETDSENEEESTDSEELEEGETATVDENAPHEPEHATDFNDGSSDRIAIKNAVMEATGLGNDLIEWWIGNDGPGQVIATVSDSSQSVYYDVYLQYGDGDWHVTSYERVSGN